ncbi:MAG: queuosine precursor transporter [Chlamydiae bacterium]|nr:queuosine precursor transporter [Chlamydiota bacterium]
MNECIFFLHIALIFFLTLGAFRLGKEALMTWISVQAILANFFVLKQVTIGGWVVTCSDAFAVGSLIGLNTLQACFGPSETKKASIISLACMLVFALLSKVHLLYIPAQEDLAHPHYQALLAHAPRLLLASLFTFFLVQIIDRKLFGLFFSKQHSFASCNLFSLSCSQLLDTVLFSVLGLYGVVSPLSDIIFISFLIKVVAVIFLTPAMLILARKIPRWSPS